MKCLECDTELVQKECFCICEKCKVVYEDINANISYEKLIKIVNDILDDFQKFLFQNENTINKIEQKELIGEILNENEIKIKEFLLVFQRARTDFLGLPQNGLRCRQNMYVILTRIKESIPEIKELIKNVNLQM